MSSLQKQSQSHVKYNNLQLCLQTIIHNEPISRSGIMRITHISKPTVSNLIDELISREIIYEIGTGRSMGSGRKPILLGFNSTKKLLLAFKMGRTAYRIALSDLRGHILEMIQEDFTEPISAEQKLLIIKKSISGLLNKAKVNKDRLLKAIGIAAGIFPGIGGNATMLFSYKGFTEEKVKGFFFDLFGNNLLINHSTKLSLLGEKIGGKAREYKNVVYIDLTYGLGCAIMTNGEIYFGPDNSSGEVGYFYSSPDEFSKARLEPFEFGSLESRISGKAIQEAAQAATSNTRSSKIYELCRGNITKISTRTVFEAARFHDSLAMSILEEAFLYFNMALCNIINLLTPELVILGGGVSNAGDILLGLITRGVEGKTIAKPRFELSEMKNSASIVGALHYLINSTDYLDEL